MWVCLVVSIFSWYDIQLALGIEQRLPWETNVLSMDGSQIKLGLADGGNCLFFISEDEIVHNLFFTWIFNRLA